jgi:hypothetical protein
VTVVRQVVACLEIALFQDSDSGRPGLHSVEEIGHSARSGAMNVLILAAQFFCEASLTCD